MRFIRHPLIPCLVIVSLSLAMPALAEGVHTPTAGQAVGGQLNEEANATTEPPPPFFLTVASPRASIIQPANEMPPPPPPFGAAFNFARQHGLVVTWVGRPVVIRLSPFIEGVWYERTFGRLFTRLEVQVHRPDDPEHPDGWVTLGVDGARGVRFGPSLGHADVKVVHVCHHPGVYRLRAIVWTGAEPLHPDDPAAPPVNPDYAHDVVPIDVVVFADPPPADDTFNEDESGSREDFSEALEPWMGEDLPAEAAEPQMPLGMP